MQQRLMVWITVWQRTALHRSICPESSVNYISALSDTDSGLWRKIRFINVSSTRNWQSHIRADTLNNCEQQKNCYSWIKKRKSLQLIRAKHLRRIGDNTMMNISSCCRAWLIFSLLHRHQTCKYLTQTINLEEPIILLDCAVCWQSNGNQINSYKTSDSIKTTWKSSEALGKTLLRGRGMRTVRLVVIMEDF